MPLFEYVCNGCKNRFEVIVFGSSEPECPLCRGRDLEKQLSTFAVGSSTREAAPRPAAGPCANCHDPRGPGACMME